MEDAAPPRLESRGIRRVHSMKIELQKLRRPQTGGIDYHRNFSCPNCGEEKSINIIDLRAEFKACRTCNYEFTTEELRNHGKY